MANRIFTRKCHEKLTLEQDPPVGSQAAAFWRRVAEYPSLSKTENKYKVHAQW
jgi:hypothetical protein